MAVVVTPDDVALGWRPLSDEEATAAEGLIVRAGVVLGALVPDLDSKPDDLARVVIANMARRVLKNPDGYRIRNVSIDDYTEGGTVDNTLATGEVYPSADELAWLGVIVDKPRAFEIRLGSS
jgi:hypothetical protein